jgi:hypothetical protein
MLFPGEKNIRVKEEFYNTLEHNRFFVVCMDKMFEILKERTSCSFLVKEQQIITIFERPGDAPADHWTNESRLKNNEE